METMNWKIPVLHGIIGGVLAASAGVIYLTIYKEAFDINYAKVINAASITGSCLFSCLLMAGGYALLQRFKKTRYTGILNIVIALLSFASITGPISITLPLDTASPELFPGLAIPMHFFPALAFFTIAPFFVKKPSTNA
jgi:hypothetical protein